MRRRAWLLSMAWITAAPSAPGAPPAPIELNGQYEFLPDLRAEVSPEPPTGTPWGRCHVPALWWEAESVGEGWRRGDPPGCVTTPYAWYRRTFLVPADRAGFDARIEFESALWGCEVWLNGRRIGRHEGGYAPFVFDCTDALKPGRENELLLRLDGWKSIPRDDKGRPLITIGVDAPWANKSGGFTGDLRLTFYRGAGIDWLQFLPDVDRKAVRVRAGVHSKCAGEATLTLILTDPDGREASEPVHRAITLAPGERIVDLGVVVLETARLWSPNHPRLYRARCVLAGPDGNHDVRLDRFGLRAFECRGNRLYLNGEPFRLFGAELFEEPRFKRGYRATLDPDFVRRYLIDYPKQMNLNAFRTHLGPMNQRWLDVCDEGGMLVILEFPVFYWHDDPRFREFVRREYEALLPRLWNHPSIIMWAISNEGWNDSQRKFENETIAPWFREQDPSRPVLRAGDVSPDVADIHTYEGIWHGSAGDFVQRNSQWVESHRTIPVANTEYLETGAGPDGWWYNRNRAKRFFDDDATPADLAGLHAQLALEQTEFLRRLGFQIIMPYWYPDWVNLSTWAANYADPSYPKEKLTVHALKQAFAPCGISLDVENRNVRPGDTLPVGVWLMNDSGRPRRVEARVGLQRRDPAFRLDQVTALDGPPHSVTLAPASMQHFEQTIRIPADAGADPTDAKLYLVATIAEQGRPLALSQRTLRLAPRARAALSGRGVILIPNDPAVRAFLQQEGAVVFDRLEAAPEDATILIPEHEEALSDEVWDQVVRRVESGAVAILLRATEGLRPGWPEVYRLPHSTDYLFAASGSGLPDLRDPNGLEPALCYAVGPDSSRDRVLMYGYPDSSGTPAAAVLARPLGRGTVICCQVELAGRLAEGDAHADPFCQELVTRLITQGRAKPDRPAESAAVHPVGLVQ